MRSSEITNLCQFFQGLDGLTLEFENFFALLGTSTGDRPLIEELCVVSTMLNIEEIIF